MAQTWLHEHGHEMGTLRYAEYVWDFRCGAGLPEPAQQFHYLPSPFGSDRWCLPNLLWLVHGWLVVFNPPGREAERADERIVVWIDESTGAVRGDVPGG